MAKENDINKAPNDFFKNLKNTKTIRYNSVIQIQIKSLSEKKLTQAMEFEVSQFPEFTAHNVFGKFPNMAS